MQRPSRGRLLNLLTYVNLFKMMHGKVYNLLGGMRQINKEEDLLTRGQIVVFKGYGIEKEYAVTGHKNNLNNYQIVALDGSGFSDTYAGSIHQPDGPHGIGYYWPLPGQPRTATEDQVAAAIAKAQYNADTEARNRKAQFDAREEAKKAGLAIYELTRPAWAKAVIMARRKVDDSDPMTDYYGHTTDKTVVLCFSKHTRNNFQELKNAARLYADTAHLADAPAEEVEHRENYSMGGGYYLGTSRHRGWEVYKMPLTEYTENDIALCAGKYKGREYLPGQVIDAPAKKAEAPVQNNPNVATQLWKTEGLSLVCKMEAVENAEKEGLELHFDGKPNEAVLAVLRESMQANGRRAWRWHRSGKFWYAKDTDITRADVEKIKSLL